MGFVVGQDSTVGVGTAVCAGSGVLDGREVGEGVTVAVSVGGTGVWVGDGKGDAVAVAVLIGTAVNVAGSNASVTITTGAGRRVGVEDGEGGKVGDAGRVTVVTTASLAVQPPNHKISVPTMTMPQTGLRYVRLLRETILLRLRLQKCLL